MIIVSPFRTCLNFAHSAKVQKYEHCWTEQKRSPNFLFVVCTYNSVDHYGKRIKIHHGCPFEGWSNRPISRFLPKRVGWPCPVRSVLKRTPMQDLNYFSVMFYYIIRTTYQKIGDLFWSLIFLDFRTVHRGAFCQFTLRWIYYCLSSKSTGKETGKTHRCAVW